MWPRYEFRTWLDPVLGEPYLARHPDYRGGLLGPWQEAWQYSLAEAERANADTDENGYLVPPGDPIATIHPTGVLVLTDAETAETLIQRYHGGVAAGRFVVAMRAAPDGRLMLTYPATPALPSDVTAPAGPGRFARILRHHGWTGQPVHILVDPPRADAAHTMARDRLRRHVEFLATGLAVDVYTPRVDDDTMDTSDSATSDGATRTRPVPRPDPAAALRERLRPQLAEFRTFTRSTVNSLNTRLRDLTSDGSWWEALPGWLRGRVGAVQLAMMTIPVRLSSLATVDDLDRMSHQALTVLDNEVRQLETQLHDDLQLTDAVQLLRRFTMKETDTGWHFSRTSAGQQVPHSPLARQPDALRVLVELGNLDAESPDPDGPDAWTAALTFLDLLPDGAGHAAIVEIHAIGDLSSSDLEQRVDERRERAGRLVGPLAVRPHLLVDDGELRIGRFVGRFDANGRETFVSSTWEFRFHSRLQTSPGLSTPYGFRTIPSPAPRPPVYYFRFPGWQVQEVPVAQRRQPVIRVHREDASPFQSVSLPARVPDGFVVVIDRPIETVHQVVDSDLLESALAGDMAAYVVVTGARPDFSPASVVLSRTDSTVMALWDLPGVAATVEALTSGSAPLWTRPEHGHDTSSWTAVVDHLREIAAVADQELNGDLRSLRDALAGLAERLPDASTELVLNESHVPTVYHAVAMFLEARDPMFGPPDPGPGLDRSSESLKPGLAQQGWTYTQVQQQPSLNDKTYYALQVPPNTLPSNHLRPHLATHGALLVSAEPPQLNDGEVLVEIAGGLAHDISALPAFPGRLTARDNGVLLGFEAITYVMMDRQPPEGGPRYVEVRPIFGGTQVRRMEFGPDNDRAVAEVFAEFEAVKKPGLVGDGTMRQAAASGTPRFSVRLPGADHHIRRDDGAVVGATLDRRR